MNQEERQQDEAAPDAPSRSPLRWWIALAVCLFLVGYPLSVGPIVFLDDKFPKMIDPLEPALEAAYAPLGYLYENSQVVRDFYDWYLPWWGFHGQPW
jgi:hypothetical protein